MQHNDQGEESSKEDAAYRTDLLPLQLLDDGRQAAENQADEQGIGRQGITVKCPGNHKAQPCNGHHHANGKGQQGHDGFLKLLEEVGDAVNQRVVDAHGDHHRAAADARNNVGQANDQAAQNV